MLAFPIGATVRLRSHPETHVGTVFGGAIHCGVMRYIFHLDERITAFTFPDRYIYRDNLEECPSLTDDQVAGINAAGLVNASGNSAAA